MLLSLYSAVALAALLVFGLALLAAAFWRPRVKTLSLPDAWKQYRFRLSHVRADLPGL